MRFILFFMICSCSLNSIAQNNEATDSLIVKLNSNIYLEHVPNDSTDGYFKRIDSIIGKTKAIRIKLTAKAAMGSVLEIFNPYDVPFVYKAFIYNFKKKKYLEASVYPVQPKMGVRETWPFPIENLFIKQIKLETEK